MQRSDGSVPLERIEHPVQRLQRVRLQQGDVDFAKIAQHSGQGRAMAHAKALVRLQAVPSVFEAKGTLRRRTAADVLAESYNGTLTRFGLFDAFPSRSRARTAMDMTLPTASASSFLQDHY